MSESRQPTNDELILQLLREVLARREQASAASAPTAAPPPKPQAAASTEPAPASRQVKRTSQEEIDPETGLRRSEIEALDLYETIAREPAAAETGARRLLSRLITGVVLAIILINIPLFKGLPLARALPDTRALIVRDGLVMKGSGPEIYVLQENHKRWISSLDAFSHYGYAWEDVHTVEDSFLAQFPDGPPLHVLLKCPDSPHIYRLENAQKRWIKDIATFVAEGHVWDDVQTVQCAYLRSLPNGPTIPPDAGAAPQP